MAPSLKTRVITSVICIPAVILVLLAPKFVMTLVVLAASIVGLYEYFKAVGLHEHKLLCLMGYGAAVVISFGAGLSVTTPLLLIYLYVVVLFAIMICSHKNITLVHLSKLFFGLIYIPYFLSHIIYVRALEFGNFYVWLVFIGAFLSDTCAYFTGSFMGRHKLCPEISPHKTIEGAVGGLVGGGLSFVLFGLIVNLFFGKFLGGMHFALLRMFVFGVFASCVSQIGDLAASSIKRQFGIKDFGSILPGHGGILDRCDSIILVAPMIFFFLHIVEILI